MSGFCEKEGETRKYAPDDMNFLTGRNRFPAEIASDFGWESTCTDVA